MLSIHDIKMQKKLLILFLFIGLVPVIVIGWWATSKAQESLMSQSFAQLRGMRDVKKAQVDTFLADRKDDLNVLVETVGTLRAEAINKLSAVRDIKRTAVESYFQTINDQMLTFSEDKMIVDAMKDFKRSFGSFRSENGTGSIQLNTYMESVSGYYTDQFAAEYKNQNNGSTPDVSAILDKLDDDSIALQYHYISSNPNPLGSKEELDAADDRSQYSRHHATYHPIIRNYLKKFGYYDIFLVDPDSGDIVYSVFKELDYSTSLIDGPYSDTNFAEAFRLANAAANKDDIFLVDYKTYTPSFEAPASFIASPIFDGGEKIGVAIFQMPIDRLNYIMSERNGLGETGETYLVGPDYLMRSDSYLEPEHHTVITSFKNPEQGKADTAAVRAALGSETGTDVISDYNGNPVLSAYMPVKVGGFTWALLAEVDVAEAFCPKDQKGEYFFQHYVDLYGYYDLFLMNPDGYVFYTVAQESDYQTNMLNGPYRSSGLGKITKNAIQTKQFAFADFEPYAPSNDEPAAFIAQPVLHDNDVEIVVALQLSIDAINNIMQERSGMGLSGETYLVGSDQLMRSDSFLDPVNHTVVASFANPSLGSVKTDGVMDALNGITDSKVISDYNGNDVLSAYVPVDVWGSNWALLAEIDLAEVNQPINALIYSIVLGVILAAALIIGIAIYIARSISSPLIKGVELAQAIAKGDLTQDIDVNQKDEIGMLADSLRQMNKNISEIIMNIQQAAEQVAASSEELSSSSQNLASCSTEQASSLEETSASIEELLSSISSNADHSNKANEHVKEASSLSENTAQVSEEGMKSVLNMSEAMEQINQSSKEIAHVIDVINDIADQTNLLALNAAIEAARAGEAGKGFAVVADEVRKLAERSQVASKDIAEKIKASIQTVNNGNLHAEKSREVLQKIQECSRDVSEKLAETSKLAGMISATCDEQSEGSKQISEAIVTLDQVTQQNSATSEESASASEELSSQAIHLQEMVAFFKVQSDGKRHGNGGNNGGDMHSHQITQKTEKRLEIAHQ